MPEDPANGASRYVTVFRQLTESDNRDDGERYIAHGKHRNDRYKYNSEQDNFTPVARPIAVIDAGVEMPSDNLDEWCESHAGKAVLSQFLSDVEEPDVTLLDTEN